MNQISGIIGFCLYFVCVILYVIRRKDLGSLRNKVFDENYPNLKYLYTSTIFLTLASIIALVVEFASDNDIAEHDDAFLVGLYTFFFGEILWAALFEVDSPGIFSRSTASLSIASGGAILMLYSINWDSSNWLSIVATSFIVFQTCFLDNVLWVNLEYNANAKPKVELSVGPLYVFYYGIIFPALVYYSLDPDGGALLAAWVSFVLSIVHFIVGGLSKFSESISLSDVIAVFRDRYSRPLAVIADALITGSLIVAAIAIWVPDDRTTLSLVAIILAFAGNGFCVSDWMIETQSGLEQKSSAARFEYLINQF
jgi:hypothetical protein